jgi:DNA-binding winged helix-turn-helix (wHTH) protein/TolB-like protein
MDPHRFRFGMFAFDAASGELRREGALVRLQAQPARVLSVLVAHPGQVVSREQMREAIWGEETFVDFERGLNVCIAHIRTALGDDSIAPRYIRTVPRQGYQFIAPVESLPDPVEVPVSQPAVSRSPRLRTIALSAAALALFALIAAIAHLWRQAAPASQQPLIVAVVRFDNETGDPAISRISDGLTDTLVEQLTRTSQDRFRVIANASVLRLPRDQRDLNVIAATLHAQFIVLGQVQRSGSQTRVLAHLIRMPEQTHVWVVRLDKPLDEPLAFQSSAAQQIASEFSSRLAAAAQGNRLHPSPTN